MIATKLAVAIVAEQDAEPVALNRWFSNGKDVRSDFAISSEVLKFVQHHGAKSVVLTEGIIGCPHEEGVDIQKERFVRNARSGAIATAGRAN
jgi:hypothetical protein